MRTNKKYLLATLSAGAALSLVGAAILPTTVRHLAYNAMGESVSYALTLDGTTAFTGNVASVTTDLGNKLNFTSSSGSLSLPNGGTLINNTKITGIKSVAVVMTSGSLAFTYDWDSSFATARDGGSLTASGSVSFGGYGPDYFKITASSATTITSITVTYSCVQSTKYLDGTTLNGVMDDPGYTTAIKANVSQIKKNDKNYINFYAYAGNGGVHVFADYHMSSLKNNETSTDWWQNDNFELRLASLPLASTYNAIQLWVSANTALSNGGTNGTALGITSPVGDATNGYSMTFELYQAYGTTCLPQTSKNQTITFQAGTNMAVGFYNTNVWCPSSPAGNYVAPTIRADGIHNNTTQNAVETAVTGKTGTELLSAPVTASDAAADWTENCRLKFDGTTDWEALYTFSIVHPSTDTDWSHTYVADICSYALNASNVMAEWAQGGWTLRGDWWGWGAWNSQGKNATSGENSLVGFPGQWSAATVDATVTLDIKWNKSDKQIVVFSKVVSNTSAYSGKIGYVVYATQFVTYSGEMHVNLGGHYATVTVTSAKLISGNAVA